MAISFFANGIAIVVIVTHAEPHMKISLRPYTSASLPQSNCFFFLNCQLGAQSEERETNGLTDHEATKGKRVRGDDPLLSALWDMKFCPDCWQRDDHRLHDHGLRSILLAWYLASRENGFIR